MISDVHVVLSTRKWTRHTCRQADNAYKETHRLPTPSYNRLKTRLATTSTLSSGPTRLLTISPMTADISELSGIEAPWVSCRATSR